MRLHHSGGARRGKTPLIAGFLFVILYCPAALGQAETSEEAPSSLAQPPADSVAVTSDEGNPEDPGRRMTHWNEYEGPYFTARLGYGLLYDTANYSQDEDSEDQFLQEPDDYVRDARFLLKGRFPKIPRLSYTVGYMYDANKEDWFFRQTGLVVDVPELGGSLFIGRTKEGISMNKIMIGYDGWTNERATVNDAFLPILADGLAWRGYAKDGGFAYNIGIYGDQISKNETFNKNDKQVIVRGVWQPLHETEQVLHLGAAVRYGLANDDFLQYRSRPESYSAEYVIDTGAFPAQDSLMLGLEAYYRPGPLMFGMEYLMNQVSSRQMGDPFLHGGEIFVAWTPTGEVRPYNSKRAIFGGIVPNSSVFDGGRGAWELALRFSYTDLDDGPIQGGKFWRVTPMVNWHLSKNVRIEFVYGYGELDRFGIHGGTQFFQTRIQFQL